MDPRQVHAGDDGLLRCSLCGTVYDLEPSTAADAVRKRTAEFVAAVTATPASARDQRPDARTWSVNAYAAHTAEVVGRLTERMRRILDEDVPDIQGVDEDALAERERYDEVPAQRSAALVAQRAAGAVAVLEEVAARPEAMDLWRRYGLHSKQGQLALWQVACDVVHELHHHGEDVIAVAHRVDDLRD